MSFLTSKKLLFILRLILDICLQTKKALEASSSIPTPFTLIYLFDLSFLEYLFIEKA